MYPQQGIHVRMPSLQPCEELKQSLDLLRRSKAYGQLSAVPLVHAMLQPLRRSKGSGPLREVRLG